MIIPRKKQYIEKYHNFWFFVIRIRIHSEQYPTINDVRKPTIGKLNSLPNERILINLTIDDPKIAGIANWKENLKASFGSTPKYSAVEIVIPDLDIPGMTAIHCAKPIIKALLIVIFLFDSFGKNFVRNRNNPVKVIAYVATEKASSESSRSISIFSKKKKANIMIGIVPTEICKISLIRLESKFDSVFL